MMRCYDEGPLRAYLDNELSAPERTALVAHLDRCAACRKQLERERALAASTAGLLAEPVAAPNVSAAWTRMRDRLPETARAVQARKEGTRMPDSRPSTTPSFFAYFRAKPARPVFSGIVAILALTLIVTIAPVQSMADQFLQLFRVQSTIYMPVTPARLKELANLGTDPSSFFLSTPRVVNRSGETQVASATAASTLVGFPLSQVTKFPAPVQQTTYQVMGPSELTFQANVSHMQDVLLALNIHDVALPDSLGTAPITATVPSFAVTTYTGVSANGGYTVTLVQGTSPTVQLPQGVSLQQVGRVGLEVLGMDPTQAQALSRQINWNSTLVVPFPADMSAIHQVQIGSVQGLEIRENGSSGIFQQVSASKAKVVASITQTTSTINDNEQGLALYWQHGDHFYMMQARGTVPNLENTMLVAAASVQ